MSSSISMCAKCVPNSNKEIPVSFVLNFTNNILSTSLVVLYANDNFIAISVYFGRQLLVFCQFNFFWNCCFLIKFDLLHSKSVLSGSTDRILLGVFWQNHSCSKICIYGKKIKHHVADMTKFNIFLQVGHITNVNSWYVHLRKISEESCVWGFLQFWFFRFDGQIDSQIT